MRWFRSTEVTQLAVAWMRDLKRAPEPFSAPVAQPKQGSLEVPLVTFAVPFRLEEQDYLGRQRHESRL